MVSALFTAFALIAAGQTDIAPARGSGFGDLRGETVAERGPREIIVRSERTDRPAR